MSMKKTTITCDACGTAKGAEFSGPHPISPYVWFTISHEGTPRGISPFPRMTSPPTPAPDLCSWECVAAYAAGRADRAAQAEVSDAEKLAKMDKSVTQ